MYTLDIYLYFIVVFYFFPHRVTKTEEYLPMLYMNSLNNRIKHLVVRALILCKCKWCSVGAMLFKVKDGLSVLYCSK